MEMKIFLYSKEDGSLFKEYLASEMFEAKAEYEKQVSAGKKIGYLENPIFPGTGSELIWDKNLLNFRFKTAQERIDEGTLVLKPFQKIVNNAVMDKTFYEMYQDGTIFNTPETILYKVTEAGRIVRKNLLDLFDIGYNKKPIFEGLLYNINKVLDVKRQDLIKKYPRAESDLFSQKTTIASKWISLELQEKRNLMVDPNTRGEYNLLFEEFWLGLSEADKKDNELLIQKLDSLSNIIIENNKKYSEALATIIEERKKITSVWSGNESNLTKQDIIALQDQYGLKADETYLFEGAYAFPPDLNLIDPRNAR